MKQILLFASIISSFQCLTSYPVKNNENPMENPELFGGDMSGIALTGDRNGVPLNTQRWPERVIHYEIDNSLTNQSANLILGAMSHISQHTCIKFVEKTAQTTDYVHIFFGQGCYSNVGRTGGQQPLSLGNGCLYLNTAVHELTHAIGFFHEQNRSDRDKYIRIHWENIMDQSKDQFVLLAPNQNRIITDFDFDSVMLYGPKTFSKNNNITMESIVPGKSIKNADLSVGLSPIDMTMINKLYDC